MNDIDYDDYLNQGRYQEIIFHVKVPDTIEKSYYYSLALHHLGNFEEASKIAFQWIKTLGNEEADWKCKFLNFLGLNSQFKGRYKESLTYYEEASMIARQSNNVSQHITALNGLGNVYSFRGDLEAAKSYYRQSLTFRDEIGEHKVIAYSLHGLGTINFYEGNNEGGLTYFLESLELRQRLGNIEDISYILANFVVSCSELYPDQAKLYYAQLQDIGSRQNIQTGIMIRVAKAFLLKISTRMRDKMQAQLMLEELIHDYPDGFFMDIDCYYSFIELLLYEYQSSDDDMVLEEIMIYSRKLYEIAFKQHLKSELVKILILRSKLSQIQNDFEKADQLLVKARGIAERNGMKFMCKRVRDEQQKLVKTFSLLGNRMYQSVDVRLNRIELIDYLQSIKTMVVSDL